ncbi:hypothetical protein C9374_013439 [Naegleria lovaniensis]|uniref:Zn(2)-C6 fungal-type domain-containing protein n=1 Tax=Naegleria lovaniensis TaxID=51637 RepID=A0AA88H1D9_NAELO|nr:uncharacterized protein C9374_013439 [Naegleria lovaniensis]KAG2391954.1 hypothetical protein C9374_013439 [Naegleria lovaniensis]
MLINSMTSEHQQQHHNHATTNQLPPPSNHHHHSILLTNHSTNTCSDKTPSSTLNMTHHDDIPMSDVAAIQSNNRNSMPPPSSSLFTQQQQQNTNHTTGGSILDILSSQSHSTTHHTHTSRINARKSLDPSVLANATTAHMVSSSNNANNIMIPSQQQAQNGVSHSSSDYYHQDSHSATTAFSPRFSRQFSQPPLFHMNNNNSTTLANTQQQQQQQGTTQEASLSDDEEGSTSQTNGSSSNAANGSSRRVNYACTECRKAHKACSGERPCDRCKKLGMEDKCKSSVRKKRILTKRYWVHFMSNGTSGGNSTTMTSSDMMDDNSVQSPATNVSQQHQSFPNLNLNVVNSASSNNPRSSSMNYKRHSSATLPSYNSIRRLNAGLSGGSSTSLTSNSELNDNVSNTVMLMDSSDNNSNNRSPRQGPFYHPYKSPRMMNPSEQQLQQQQQNSTNQESMHLDNTNRHGHSQTSSPRGGHHASTMNVSSPFTNSQLQPQSMYPSQQPSMTAVPISSTAFNNTTVSSTAGSSSYPSFPGLEAYKLDQPSPNSALTTNNHMNQTSSTSNPQQQQQVDPQQQQHLHPRSLSATSAASSSLGYHHGKSLSDSNLLPPPSSLLYNNSGSTTTSTSPNISHLSNTSLHSTTTASPFGGVSESTITSSGYLNHSNNNGTGLHIPPILLGDEQQPNTTQIQHQAHHSHHSSPQQLHPQLSPYPQQWSSQQGNVNNNTTPSSNTSSTTATPRGLMFYGNNGSANDLVNSPRASSDYLYSPRSDYSSDFSSLTNSPRFGAGGTDSNSSTPRGLIGSMSGMNINENMEASQQPFNPFSVTNSQLNTLSTQPNNNNSNGTQRYRGQRSSAQFHHQQLSYDSALNVSGTRKSIAGYLNHAGNRYSLGSFAYSQFHGSAYSNPSTTTTTTSNNYGSGNPQINISSETSGNNGILPNNMAPNKRHSQHFSNNPHNRYSLGPNHELHGLTMNQSANSNSNISGNTQSNNHTLLHPTTK